MKITKDTTAHDFFTKIIPQRFEKMKDKLTDAHKQAKAVMGVKLEGEGGGEWGIYFENGELKVSKGLPADARPVVMADVNHWRQAVTGEIGFVGNPTDAFGGNMNQFKPVVIQRMQAITGTIEFVVDDDANQWKLRLSFGQSAPATPQTTVVIKAADAAMIGEGKLNPQQAFMNGKIRITGDMNLAMQVGSLSMM